MPTTAPNLLRYPLASDAPDIPRDFKNLADDTETALGKKSDNGHIHGYTTPADLDYAFADATLSRSQPLWNRIKALERSRPVAYSVVVVINLPNAASTNYVPCSLPFGICGVGSANGLVGGGAQYWRALRIAQEDGLPNPPGNHNFFVAFDPAFGSAWGPLAVRFNVVASGMSTASEPGQGLPQAAPQAGRLHTAMDDILAAPTLTLTNADIGAAPLTDFANGVHKNIPQGWSWTKDGALFWQPDKVTIA
jgi:hypothetical protein